LTRLPALAKTRSMMAPDDQPPAAPEGEAQFDTGCAGCLTLVLVICAGFFAIAAFDPTILDALADGRRRYRLTGLLLATRQGGVSIGALLLACYMAFETVRAGRKAIDPRAVWIDSDMIRFHPTLRTKPLSLAAIEEVRHEAGDIGSVLRITHGGGRCIKVPMMDPEAAEAFVAAVERARAERTFG
jgi:hypothetical protein